MNQQYDAYFYGYHTPPYITPQPESSTVQVSEGGVIVLASDGLWDVVSTKEVTEVVCGEMTTEESNIAKSVLRFAMNKRPPGDDTTVVVLRCSAQSPEAAAVVDE